MIMLQRNIASKNTIGRDDMEGGRNPIEEPVTMKPINLVLAAAAAVMASGAAAKTGDAPNT